jgi:hypothetical protein
MQYKLSENSAGIVKRHYLISLPFFFHLISGVVQLLDLLHIPSSLLATSRVRSGDQGGVLPISVQGGGEEMPLPHQGTGR